MALGDPGGTGTGSYSQASPEKHRVSVRLHMCPSRACSYVWVHVPMSTCLCASNVSLICVHLLSMCVWEQTQLCVCMHLCAHPWACIHFSPCAPGPTSVFPCASNVPVHLWLCTHMPVLVRVMCSENLYRSWQPFSGKAKRSNNFGFAGHVVSVTTTQLSHCSEKAATDKK